MLRSSWTLPLTACVLALLGGCASAATHRSVRDLTPEERERLMIRPEDAPPGRDCSVSLESPPAFAELVDSAAFHSDIVRDGQNAGNSVERTGRAVFTIRIDSTGSATRIDVLSSSLSDTALAVLSDLFPGRVKARMVDSDDGPQRSGWTFRIAVDVGPSPAFSVSRPVGCRPTLRNEAQVRAKLNALMNLQGLSDSGPGQTTLLWIFVGEDGRPQRMQVTRSSGNPMLDQIAQHAAADAVSTRRSSTVTR